MDDGSRADRARQAANVAGALFQVLAGFLLPFRAAVDGGPPVRPLIQPADYAFAIWGPIFLFCLAYAVYQALPAKRENPALRRVGWFTFGAFFSIGLFEVMVALRQFDPAQAFIVGAFICAGIAYLRLARSERCSLSGAERWLVASSLGLFFGWITAATVVNTAGGVLALLGLPEGGLAEALSGGVLLLLGSLLASAMILTGKHAPPQGYLAYAASVLWALLGVVVAQHDASLVTTGAALVAAASVALALLRRAR